MRLGVTNTFRFSPERARGWLTFDIQRRSNDIVRAFMNIHDDVIIDGWNVVTDPLLRLPVERSHNYRRATKTFSETTCLPTTIVNVGGFDRVHDACL